MSAVAVKARDDQNWMIAGGVAIAAHVAVAGLVLAWARPAEPPVPEPVVLIELPPPSAQALDAAEPQTAAQQPLSTIAPQPETPPIDIPPVRAPLPSNPVVLPPSAPSQPIQAAAPVPVVAAASPVAPAVASAASANSAASSADPRAKQQEANYFALVSAHLNRRKTYPVEARQARQQGVTVVRFTLDRNGGVSAVTIKRGSGHAILDTATLALVQRVAPFPRIPASLGRDQLTLSLPIDYSLRTD